MTCIETEMMVALGVGIITIAITIIAVVLTYKEIDKRYRK